MTNAPAAAPITQICARGASTDNLQVGKPNGGSVRCIDAECRSRNVSRKRLVCADRDRRISGSNLSGVVCEQGDLDPVVERKLFEYPRDVRLDGRDAHVELAADLSVGLAEPDRDGNLAFALAEAVELLAGVALAVVGHPVSDVPDQPAGDRWGEYRVAGGDGPHGTDE